MMGDGDSISVVVVVVCDDVLLCDVNDVHVGPDVSVVVVRGDTMSSLTSISTCDIIDGDVIVCDDVWCDGDNRCDDDGICDNDILFLRCGEPYAR